MPSTPRATALAHVSPIRCSYCSLEQGQGNGTAHKGRPAAKACRSTSSRRTACMATRPAASLKVVSSPATSYCVCREAQRGSMHCPCHYSRKAEPVSSRSQSFTSAQFRKGSAVKADLRATVACAKGGGERHSGGCHPDRASFPNFPNMGNTGVPATKRNTSLTVLHESLP